mgnify:CR=1 FL=1
MYKRQAFHDGEAFNGPVEPFGRLVYYLDRSAHPLAPTTSAGLFLGWRLECGLRFRNVLLIANYDAVRERGFLLQLVRSIPQKEVYFPENLDFPYAVARDKALASLEDVEPPGPAPPVGSVRLPWDEEQSDSPAPAAVPPPPASAFPKFKITLNRIIKYFLIYKSSS